MKKYTIPLNLLSDIQIYFPDLERFYIAALHQHRENHDDSIGRQYEKQIVTAVADGNLQFIKSLIHKTNLIMLVGDLSADTTDQLRYYAVAFITLITRAAIDGGMPEEEGFALSDALIQKLDTLRTCDRINRLTALALLEFTKRMERYARHKYAPPVSKCQAYISEHLHENISIEELSTTVGLSPGRLSVLFKSETGFTTKQYILREKVLAARELLVNSSLSIQEIASTYSFASSSHFSLTFKKLLGVTPSQWKQTPF